MPKNSEIKKELAKRFAGIGVPSMEPTKYQAIQPDTAAYNTYNTGYASALQQNTGFEGANILNRRALGVEADQENQRYIQALAAAQANQVALQKQAGIINATDTLNKHNLDTDINKTVGVGSIDQNTGQYIMPPENAAVQTSENLNVEHAGALKDTAGAIKDLTGSGYLIPPETVGSMIAPAGQEKPTSVAENFTPIKLDNGTVVQMTADQTNDYIKALAEGRKADAAMIAAQAAEYHARHPSNTGSKTVVQYGIDGRPIVTTVTNPGADPPDSYIPNPKPDVRSGGTSGKPSAASLEPIDTEKVRQIGSQFGTVTSVTRSAEHNKEVGGVKNSFHVDYGKGGHAIDIVPKHGVTKEQIANHYREMGFNVVESINEGDHIHTAFGNSSTQVATAQARRPVPGGLDRIVHLAQAKGYPNRVTANGVEVSFPNGHKVVYNDQGKVTSASQ